MKHMRKFLITITVLIISAFLITGCNSITRLNLKYNDNDNLKNLKYKEIKFLVSEAFVRGGFSDYRSSMIKEFRQIALDKTNTDINMVFAEETVYAETLQLRIDSGLDFDLFLGMDSIQNDRMISGMFKTTGYWIDKGYAMDLTNKITPKYKNLYRRFDKYPILKQMGTYNGKLYAIPSGIQKTDRPYVLVRDDLWEKYGTKKYISTLEDLYGFLKKVNDNEDQHYYLKTYMSIFDIMHIVAREQNMYFLPGGYLANIDDKQIKPVPLENTDIIDKATDIYMKLLNNNLIMNLNDSLNVTTALSGDKTAAYLSKNPQSYHSETAGNNPYSYTFQPMYPNLGFAVNVPTDIKLMIYSESENVDRVLTVLNWLGDSNQAYDVLSYGLEGINFKYQNKKFIFDESTEPALGWMQIMCGYPRMEKDFHTDKKKYSDTVVDHMKKAYINPLDSLMCSDQGNIETYYKQTAINDKLFGSRLQIISGYVEDVTKGKSIDVSEFKKQLKQHNNNKKIEQQLDTIINMMKDNK